MGITVDGKHSCAAPMEIRMTEKLGKTHQNINLDRRESGLLIVAQHVGRKWASLAKIS